jgi:hypothetical protein
VKKLIIATFAFLIFESDPGDAKFLNCKLFKEGCSASGSSR